MTPSSDSTPLGPIPQQPRRLRVGLGAAALLAGFVVGVVPPPTKTLSAWAAEKRVVAAESGSPFPGKWDPSRVPYLREPQDCLGFDHPSREITAAKSAQTGFSETGVNLFGYVVDQEPSPMLIVLPSLEEAAKYNKVKLQPTIEATPALREKIRDVNSRDENSSTATFKRFRGGFAVVTGANSSKGLQMISARVRIYEEVSEYPADADNRGEPTFQAESRGKAWANRGPKSFYVSTPGLAGACRITAKYDASDQRRYYVPCPHCGHYQLLEWKAMKWRSDRRPHGAYMVCAANGCVIEQIHQNAMVATVPDWRWIKTYPGNESNPAPPATFPPEQFERWAARHSDGREPGFHIWQAYSPFVPWDDTVAEFFAAGDNPLKQRVFTQQALGLPWDEKGDAPPADQLLKAREAFAWQRVPKGCLYVTAAVDVQANRVEYDVYAWRPDFSCWRIDGGVIEGDPDDAAFWLQLDPVIAKRYEDMNGKPWGIDAIGIDAGFLSQRVYGFVKRHAASGRVYALDGRPGWKLPALGTPSKRDIDFEGKKLGAVMLWPVGTWDLKSELYRALAKTIEGPDEVTGEWPPGAAHFSDRCDRGFFEQLTAEYLKSEAHKSGVTQKVWVKNKSQANERHDIAVYARALAHHLADDLTPEQWANLAAQRGASAHDAQKDLSALWAPPIEAEAVPANAVRAPGASQDAAGRERQQPAADWLGGRGRGWFGRA